jgi:prepilin-type N-terminal cleavage/methylation domain-containing protein
MTGRRLLREQGGFTLAEMMVTMVVMITVLFALYSIFDMSIRVFAFGNDKVEAVENARLGLEKMAREIRAAYPVDKANGETHLFWNQGSALTGAMPTTSQITFGNDLNGNRAIVPDSPSLGSTLDNKEEITYLLSGTTLQRRTNSGGAYVTSPVVEFVQPGGLEFIYLKSDRVTELTASELTDPANEPLIATVRIELTIEVDGGAFGARTQTLTTDVALRNRVS